MPSFTPLMRCLLIVAFCLDMGVSQWTASLMVVSEGQQAANPRHSASVKDDEDCEDASPQSGKGSSHHDCNCDSGSACCACASPVATIIHAVPFAPRQALSTQPAPRSVFALTWRDPARVFRPPIV